MDKTVNRNKLILIIVFCGLVLFGLILYNYRFSIDKEEVNNNKINVKILEDYSRFFTVNSCVYKYITYLQSKNIDNLMMVLNKDYLNNNNINNSNVLNYVENLNGNYSFVSKEIYYENIGDNFIKYYVYGNLIQDHINGKGEKVERYYIVSFDTKNYTFDITPYDKNSYEVVVNG